MTGIFHKARKAYMKKYKKGMLFGSWDCLHYGHIRIIKEAQLLCESIIVIVDSDELIYSTKKRDPIVPLQYRLLDLLQIKGVCLGGIDVEATEGETFVGSSKKHLTERYKPDVLIKGDDWKGKGWDGENLGVPVLYLPYTKGISSTMFHEAKI